MTDSAQLTKMSVAEFISPLRIVGVLRSARVPLVLVGQYGFDGWLQETRQCQCVDIVIRPRSACTTLRVLTDAFPALRWQGVEADCVFMHKKTGKALISIQPAATPLALSVFEHSVRLDPSPRLNFLIPRLEMALALSFVAMTGPPWTAQNYYSAAQFLRMVKVNPDVDWKILRSIGNLISPNEGRRLVKNVRDLHAGKRFQL